MSQRFAFKMKLKPGCAPEYQERHKKVWPEIIALLKENHVQEYSIFLDRETETLYAFQKIQNNKGSQDLGHHETIQKWWEYMADLMEVNDDFSPISIELEEVFYME